MNKLVFRVIVLVIVASTVGISGVESAESPVATSSAPVIQPQIHEIKAELHERTETDAGALPATIPLLDEGIEAPTPYPLGESMRTTTPGIPFFGVTVETGFVCVIPGEAWVDCYGAPRENGAHHGWDYVYSSMETWDVFTPMAGVVTFSAYISPYGNLVVVENSGIQVFLAHNASNYVVLGDVVEAGDLVAAAGNTGLSYGSHVHLETRKCDFDTGVCGVVDPRTIFLPGQAASCSWDFGVTKTINRLGRRYTCGWGISTYKDVVP